ncbi:pickpocket protein 28-like isoform X2 [Choristoneura fumiferana]
MQDFAQNTTLHGLGYIADKKLSTIEKIFWTVSFVTSVSLCAMLIWNVWVKWQSAPIIVTASDDLISVEEVPFPSVTICPHSKLKKSICSEDSYSDIKSPIVKKLFEAGCLVLGVPNDRTPEKFNVETVRRIYDEVSPTVRQIFHICYFYGHLSNCVELFKPVLTLEGVCYTMNSLAANEILRNDSIQSDYSYMRTSQQSVGWSHSGGYSHLNTSDDVYPRPGRRTVFTFQNVWIILRQERESVVRAYDSNDHGFKVYLHHPADLPQSSVFYYAAPSEKSISLGLKLNIVNTSSSLRSYSPDTRRCFFPGERYLRYFHTYTDNNCKLECLTNYTLQLCGCVWFHMPHNNSSIICRASRANHYCFQRAEEQFDEQEGDYNRGGRCRCYPLCLNVQYEADIVKIFNYDESQVEYRSLMRGIMDFSQYRFTCIELFYKAPKFVAMHHSELFGTTDFLANCGGLLGLFLGCSFLSIVEIIYFFTLRLSCSFRRNTQQTEYIIEKNE